MSVAFLAIIVIVALLCVMLGMAISNNQHSRVHEQISHPHVRRNGAGRGVGLLIAVMFILVLLPVVSWISFESAPDQQATVLVEADRASEAAYPPSEVSGFATSGEAIAPDQVTRPLLEEAAAASTESEAVGPADGGSNAGESKQPAESSASPEVASVAASDSAGETGWEPASAQTPSSTKIVHIESHISIWPMLGGGLFCLAMLIGAGIWIAHRRQHWSFSGMARSTVRSFWVVPMLASVGWVGYLIWPHLSAEPIERNRAYDAAQYEFDRNIDETQSQFSLPATTSGMPSWVIKGITSENGLVHVPVHGGWRESEDEARNEAQAQVLRTITRDFTLAFPSAKDWRIDVPVKDLHAVREEAVETKFFQFGSTREPMYRTHLLVELSDDVRGELVKRWQPELQEYRMATLFTFGGLLTLVFFAGATCLSLDLRTEGQYRRWLRTATVLVVIAGAAVAHGVLNSLWFQHSV